jgi:hypothetical protein
VKKSEALRRKAEELQAEMDKILEEAELQELEEELTPVAPEIVSYFRKRFTFGSKLEVEMAAGAAIFSGWLCSDQKPKASTVGSVDFIELSVGPFVARFSRSEIIRILDMSFDAESGGDDDDAFANYFVDREVDGEITFDGER